MRSLLALAWQAETQRLGPGLETSQICVLIKTTVFLSGVEALSVSYFIQRIVARLSRHIVELFARLANLHCIDMSGSLSAPQHGMRRACVCVCALCVPPP